MYATKVITKEERDKALEEQVKLRKEYISYSQNKAPYFSDYVMRELESLGFSEDEISQGGYKIYTTLNYEYQQVAQDKLWSDMRAWGMTKDEQQAALFSYETSTGKILAYIGGKDYAKSQFDRASQSVRPPGSAFKVLVYTTAVEMGMSPNMPFKDEPYTAGDWSPHNYGNKYRGEIPAYQALAFSSNVVAAKIIVDYTGDGSSQFVITIDGTQFKFDQGYGGVDYTHCNIGYIPIPKGIQYTINNLSGCRARYFPCKGEV